MHGRKMLADQPEYAMSLGTAPGSRFGFRKQGHQFSRISACFAAMHYTHGKKADAYLSSTKSDQTRSAGWKHNNRMAGKWKAS